MNIQPFFFALNEKWPEGSRGVGRGRLFEHEQETVILLRQHAVMVTLWFNRSAIKVSRVGVGWAGCLLSRGRGGMAVGFNLFFFPFLFFSRNPLFPLCIFEP